MAGVGKSLIGKALAKKLRYTLIDTDKLIEKKTKLKLQKIISRLGDGEFLKIEARIILALNLSQNCVISPGGSVVYSKEAMCFLKSHSTIIFLNTSFKNISKWIPNKSTRGIVNPHNKSLRGIFQERLPLYKKYAVITIQLREKYNQRLIVKKIIDKLLLQ